MQLREIQWKMRTQTQKPLIAILIKNFWTYHNYDFEKPNAEELLNYGMCGQRDIPKTTCSVLTKS